MLQFHTEISFISYKSWEQQIINNLSLLFHFSDPYYTYINYKISDLA